MTYKRKSYTYMLLRAGKPPFVLTVENAVAYFEPSTVICNTSKLGPMGLFRLPGIKKRFAQFLEKQANARYLLPAAMQATPTLCENDPLLNPTT